MNRTLPTRLASLLWAVLFLLSVAGDGLGAHFCPHHDGSAGAHGGDHAAAAHDGPAAHHAAGLPGEPQEHGGPCTCAGACQAGTGLALAAEPLGAPSLPAPELHLPSVAPEAAPARRRPPYFLPYAQAPPARG